MMGDIGDEIKELVDDYTELTQQEKRNEIEDELQFNDFTPDTSPKSPCGKEHRYKNPAINAYCERLEWDSGWHPISQTSVLAAYPEYIPTDEAIQTIMEYGPILEVGAGSGYLAFVLSEAGCSIKATDAMPKDIEVSDSEFYSKIGTGENNFSQMERTGLHSVDMTQYQSVEEEAIDSEEFPNIPWYTVEVADHTVVSEFPNHTILSCHPPAEIWTEEMLDLISNQQKFIYIGEWYPGQDATPMFCKTLTEWDLLETFPIYNWQSTHAQGYVFEKM